jgi:hypothetical protein
LVFALAALALPLTDAALTTAEAQAQSSNSLYQPQSSNSLYQPSLTDPRFLPRFGPPKRTAAATQQAPATIPSGSGETGFDATGATAKKKKNKPKPGDPKPAPPPPPKGRGAPQAAEGHTLSQQSVVREQYKVPDTPPRRVLVPLQDPYEPLGIRAGTFLLKPAIDITRGYDTNPSHIPNGKGTGYTVIEPTVKVRSDWAAHEFGLDGRVNYSQFDNISSLDRPNAEAKTYMRLDASRDTAINVEGRYLLSTDYPGSPNVPADVAKLPIFQTWGSSLGFTQRFNHFELLAKASYDRTTYNDSDLTDGTTSSNHDRDLDQYGGQLRGSYELWPGVKPFVEIGADTRKHDLQFDRNGFYRDSNAVTPKVGTTFDIARKLTGEVSVGYTDRRYEDPSLQPLRGVVYDAALKYEATGLTAVTLNASSRADESVVAGWSGGLRRDVGITVDHALRRWLIWSVRAGYGFDDYISNDCCGNGDQRSDQRVSLGSSITYKLSRELWLKGEYRYDQLRSNKPGVDYNANAFLVGLKLQR